MENSPAALGAAGLLGCFLHYSGDYFSRARACCGLELAMANTAVPACTRIWARVRRALSAAKSASRICDWASVRLARVSLSEARLESKVVFWKAPRRPRRPVT